MARSRSWTPARMAASSLPLLGLLPRRAEAAIIGAQTHNISSDSTQLTYSGTWRSDTSQGFYQAYSNATDAAVTFSFTGVAAVYLSQRTADRGICLLTLDNSIPYTVDLYNDSGLSSGLQVIWSSGTLPYGQHNVSITQIGPDARFGYYPYLVTSTWIEAVPTDVPAYVSTQSVPTSSATSIPPGYVVDSGPNIGAIVGGSIGAVVAACLLGFLFYLWRRERGARRRADAASAANAQKAEGKAPLDDEPDSTESMSTAPYPYGMSPYAPYGRSPYDPYAYQYSPGFGYHPASAAATWDAPSSHDYAQSRFYPSPPPPPPRSADSSDFPADYGSNRGGAQQQQPQQPLPSLSPSSSGFASASRSGGAVTSLDDSAYHSSTAQNHRYPYHVQGSGSDSRSYAIPEI
ncbi:hypothetical protein JCM10908_001618 [Rhodotorula pacifica]|uniref:uncharacterized protein n=1 Tax=Rhodotorula pacifica TaxID=1495444 RepID=UPI003180D024